MPHQRPRQPFVWTALLLLVVVAGCARVRTGPVVVRPPVIGDEERGEASWYGAPHHGRRTASGEVFDMRQMTAAHRTLPFGTSLLVEDLANGRVVEVRVNDRGPFVDGRILDLSWAAARALGATGSGVIPVRLRVVALASSDGRTGTGGFTVQLGAFVDQEHAVSLQQRVAGAETPRIEPASVGGRQVYRVRVGHFTSRAQATEHARQLAKRGYATVVVEE